MVFYLCPFSVRDVATFPGTVLFPSLNANLSFKKSILPLFVNRVAEWSNGCSIRYLRSINAVAVRRDSNR